MKRSDENQRPSLERLSAGIMHTAESIRQSAKPHLLFRDKAKALRAHARECTAELAAERGGDSVDEQTYRNIEDTIVRGLNRIIDAASLSIDELHAHADSWQRVGLFLASGGVVPYPELHNGAVSMVVAGPNRVGYLDEKGDAVILESASCDPALAVDRKRAVPCAQHALFYCEACEL